MALLRVTGLGGLKQAQPFSDNWQAQLKGTQELWHNCAINIYKEVRGKFDPETGETPVTEILVYSGKARVQPVRASRDANVVDDRTTQQVARFQISDTSINLTPDMWVKVTSEGLNPSLTRYRFKLREIVDSGNLIERTFEAVMDNESQTSQT